MRIPGVLPLTLVALGGCASQPARTSANPATDCPGRVLATVANPRPLAYDVHYVDGRGDTIIGEVAPGSTVTFPIPGEGRGRVYVRGSPIAPGTSVVGRAGQPLQEVRIRMHCSPS